MMDNDSTVRKWLFFLLLDILVIALFLGFRAMRRRKMPEGEIEGTTITELAS
jgi:hypothetical protein